MSGEARLAQRYKTLALLGEGAMGRVWLVEDEVQAQKLALKVVSGGEGGDKSLLQFKQEFRLMTRLRHPHCCAVHDYGETEDGEPYFTMEVVPGRGLDELIAAGETRDPAAFKAIFSQLLLGLGYVHQQGFVHCDLKPANVRVKPDGTVKLMDFGLMDYAGRPAAGIKGTVPYVSPEIIQRAPLDGRSDLYSVGCLAYEMLTGSPPFVAPTVVQVLRAHVGDRPVPPSQVVPGIDKQIEALVLHLLAKDPVARPATANDALAELGVEPPAGIGGSLLAAPLVGRDGEVARMRDLLRALADGQPPAPFAFVGPSGTGKSRLLEGLRFAAQLDGVAFATGSAREHGQSPFAAIADMLRGLLPAMRAHAPEAVATHAPVLVKLAPALAVEPAPEMESPRAEVLRLCAALAACIGALADRRPVVVALDDWHWADAGSQECLAYLLRAAAHHPIAYVLGARDAAPAGVEAVPIAGLDEAGVRRMVEAMLGGGLPAAGFATQVAAVSQGNPAFVERLLEHLVQAGDLTNVKGSWTAPADLAAAAVPTTLNALTQDQLRGLPAGARQLTELLAVSGRPTPLELLGAASGLDEAALFEALGALDESGVLARDDEGAYVFRQAAVQEAAHGMIPAERLPRLHGQLAGALVASLGLPAKPLAQVALADLAALATHGLRAELPQRAIGWALEAGRRFLGLFALADAKAMLAAGQALVGPDAPTRLRLDYARMGGEVARHAGDAKGSRERLDEAIPLAEELGERALLGRLLTTQAKNLQVLTDYAGSLALCARGEALSLEVGDLANASRVVVTRARVTYFQGDGAAARQAADRARELAVASGDGATIGLADAFLGYLVVAGGGQDLQAGIGHLEASLARLREAGDIPGLNSSYNLMGNAQTQLGAYAAAYATFEAARTLCEEAGLQQDRCVALVNLAGVAVELGDLQAGYDHAAAAVELADRLGSRYPLGVALGHQAVAAAGLGRPGEALKLAERAAAEAEAIGNAYIKGLVAPAHAEVLVVAGRADEALALPIADDAKGEPAARLRAARAEALGLVGRGAEARTEAAAAVKLAEAAGAAGAAVHAQAVAARAAFAAQAWDDARDGAEAALAVAESLGAGRVRAELLGLLGELALATSTPGAADRFAAMQALGEAQGAPLVVAHAAFGRAAAAPYDGAAARNVTTAQEALARAGADLDAGGLTRFFAPADRARIKAGNHIAMSLPVATRKPAPSGPLGGLGSGPLGGMMGGSGPLGL